MAVSEQTQGQIMAVIRCMVEGVARRDPDSVMALIDPGFCMLSPLGRMFGRDECRRHLERVFSRAEAISLEFSDIRISAEGTVAWITADLTRSVVAGGASQTESRQMTAVLRGTGHAWIFVQMHISTPARRR